jgi:hypothetical protein
MKAYEVSEIGRESVDHLVLEGHYLHSWPAITMGIVGLIEDTLFVRGVIVFALPPKDTPKRYGVSNCWELARLFIEDCTPKNTESWFIRRAISWVKTAHPEVQCVVSYADPAHGHQGIIYKASNWIRDGMTDEGRKTPRPDYYCEGKKYSRLAHLPVGSKYELVYRTPKFRYVYWMDKTHERRRQEQYENAQTR